MTIGPIQAFVIGFPDSDLFEGRIAEKLRRLSDVGQIRVIDAVFAMRDGDEVAAIAVSDLDNDQRAELRAAVGALIGLGVAGARVPRREPSSAPPWDRMYPAPRR